MAVKTMKVSGGDYAKVADRLLEFRNDNPRASVKTEHKIAENGSVSFSTYILKDKADEFSADATGSASYSAKEMEKPKAFEKLETISVGRALSLLGYLNNGEVASSEEMEEFEAFKEQKRREQIDQAIKNIGAADSINELRELFMSFPAFIRNSVSVVAAKDVRKEQLIKKEG